MGFGRDVRSLCHLPRVHRSTKVNMTGLLCAVALGLIQSDLDLFGLGQCSVGMLLWKCLSHHCHELELKSGPRICMTKPVRGWEKAMGHASSYKRDSLKQRQKPGWNSAMPILLTGDVHHHMKGTAIKHGYTIIH